ncbi:MAG TPA: 30S ribosomal protein S13 [Patescibacteria group bacterium]|nr:30S ribosomal protein S13 [Patescibacteria group bacterium]
MARIAGVELQDKDRLIYALTNIKGIGMSTSGKILKGLSISEAKRVKDLTGDDLTKVTSKVESFLIEGDLVRTVKSNISRLQKIGSYRGIRHTRGLPARGQRTRHNARTRRGKRKTVGAFKKEVLSKMTTPTKEEKK